MMTLLINTIIIVLKLGYFVSGFELVKNQLMDSNQKHRSAEWFSIRITKIYIATFTSSNSSAQILYWTS